MYAPGPEGGIYFIVMEICAARAFVWCGPGVSLAFVEAYLPVSGRGEGDAEGERVTRVESPEGAARRNTGTTQYHPPHTGGLAVAYSRNAEEGVYP